MRDKKFLFFLISLYLLTIICFILAYKNQTFLPINNNIYNSLFFVFLSALMESFTIKYKDLSISTGFAITFAAIIVFGTFKAMIIVSLGVALRITKYQNKYRHILNTPIYKTFFNISNFSLSIFMSSYFLNIPIYKITNYSNFLRDMFILVTIFLLVNSMIISLLVSILNNDNFFKLYISNLKFGILNIFFMAPFGLIVAYLFNVYKIFGIAILMFPITLSRYIFILYIESKNKYLETVKALMNAMEARDKYTEGHSRRVAGIVEKIAKELKYSESKIEQLNIASLLHDVGKIGIDDNILNKPGNLSEDEYSIIKKHPLIGYEILKEIKDLDEISFIVKHHHERYDGKGYPDGKKFDELNLDVFIVQLADSIDAMSTDRPYRRALSKDEVLNELVKNKGTQFHPTVVDAYIRSLKRVN